MVRHQMALRWVLSSLLATVLVACGGGGGGGSSSGSGTASAGPISTAPVANYVRLQSDAGDAFGNGQNYSYTQTNAQITVTNDGGHLFMRVIGDIIWGGDFQIGNSPAQLQPGSYTNLQKYIIDPNRGSMYWSGNGPGCGSVLGSFSISNITYANGALTGFDLQFEQHCDGRAAALRGQIHWSSSDTSTIPGPLTPPANLWRPVPGTTPLSGNYVYLQSDAGDTVGQGRTYIYTQANSNISINATGGHLRLGVVGDRSWGGNFQTMISLSQIQPGYYANLTRYLFNSQVTGGFEWGGVGGVAGLCNTVQGWVVVDNVTYVNGAINAIDLRFEQHCDGSAAALHGQIRWAPGDTTSPPGPATPPVDLWRAPSGATPASGNYVYLQSDTGDAIAQGQTYLYTQANAVFEGTTPFAGHFTLYTTGNIKWTGDFQAMNFLTKLQPGYYPGVQSFYGAYNPVIGALAWQRGLICTNAQGWFVVDNVVYTGGVVTAIDLRFEQRCDGGVPALHGQIHWTPNDTTAPAGPVNPPPANLWTPPAGATPSTGNYVYLQSDSGDPVGNGLSYTYTQANALISSYVNAGRFSLSIKGNSNWTGDFQAMSSVSQLQPGYYGNLLGYPFNNPALGGLDMVNFSGGSGCNTLTGWFVVDNISVVSGVLASIDLRFEQHCGGIGPALHGQIHWVPNDPTVPAGPVNPPPAGLWKAPVGATPASGNYTYLQSDAGDVIGAGKTYLYTPANATISVVAAQGTMSAYVTGTTEQWSGSFQAMTGISQIQPGYYGNLQRTPGNNPVFGGLDWNGNGLGCGSLTGWFAVDAVTYVNGVLASIDVRFEQHCQGATPALHGQIHWAG